MEDLARVEGRGTELREPKSPTSVARREAAGPEMVCGILGGSAANAAKVVVFSQRAWTSGGASNINSESKMFVMTIMVMHPGDG